jgi:hypothetical protein
MAHWAPSLPLGQCRAFYGREESQGIRFARKGVTTMKIAALAFVVFALSFAPAASAALSHSLVQSNPVGLFPGMEAWDLQVTVSAGDDWTSSSMNANLSAGMFFNPHVSDTFVSVAANDPDTWFAATSAAPNPMGLASTNFAGAPFVGNFLITAVWFDTANAGAGTFTIARILASTGATFTVSGSSTSLLGGSQTTAFSFNVPGPGALGMLAAGACIGRRRRHCAY